MLKTFSPDSAHPPPPPGMSFFCYSHQSLWRYFSPTLRKVCSPPLGHFCWGSKVVHFSYNTSQHSSQIISVLHSRLQRHSICLRIKSSLCGSMWFQSLLFLRLHLVSCQPLYFLWPSQSLPALASPCQAYSHSPWAPYLPIARNTLLWILTERLAFHFPVFFYWHVTHWSGLPWPPKCK